MQQKCGQGGFLDQSLIERFVQSSILVECDHDPLFQDSTCSKPGPRAVLNDGLCLPMRDGCPDGKQLR